MQPRNQRRPAARPKSRKISFIEYIAVNNTPAAARAVVKFGEQPPVSMLDLQVKMIRIMKNFQKEALKELALIHPDRNLIIDFASAEGHHEFETAITDYRNPTYSNAGGERIDTHKGTETAKKIGGTVLLVSAFLVLGGVLIASGERQRSHN